MTAHPLISIIIPVFNGENYLKEAIDSAVSQTYKNIEIIVVDDGSTDKTEIIAKSYGDKIRYFKKENGGVSSALNYGISVMKGDYFSWLSHDDKYFPNKIEEQVLFLENCEGNALAFCGVMYIDKYGKRIKKRDKNVLLSSKKINSWEKSLIALLKRGYFNGCALLIPVEAIKKTSGFDETLLFSQDFYMWIEILLKQYSVVYCNKTLVMNRIHPNQVTQRKRDLFISNMNQISELLFDELSNSSTKKYNFVYAYSIHLAKSGCSETANKYISRGREKKIIGLMQAFYIKVLILVYKAKPLFRRMYYKLVLKIKTK